MKRFVTTLIFLFTSSTVLAGVSSNILVGALNSPKVKEALVGTEINSVSVVYNKLGRAAFDFTIVICGVAQDKTNPDQINYITTEVDGAVALFPEAGVGEIVQSVQKTRNSLCVN